MKNDKYLKNLTEQVKKAEAKLRESETIELEQSRAKTGRTPKQGVKPAAELKKTRAKVASDKGESPQDRVAAIEKNLGQIGASVAYAKKMIALVGKPKEDVTVRHAALTALLTMTFSSPNSTDWMPLLLQSLRKVAQEKEGPLVVRAMEVLAQNRDDWAMERLEQGLRKAEEPLVSPIEAIYFLAYNDHGQHFDVLREVAQSSRNPGMRVAALMHMGGDPEAKPILISLSENRAERTSIRKAALLSLRALSQGDYDKVAERILSDDAEDDELQTICITTLRVDGKYEGDIRKKIEKSANSKSEKVRTAANLYLNDPQ